jgi:RimJ/RimL family protein N-acetyltransferase
MNVIQTPRLSLVLLTEQVLTASLDEPPAAAAELAGFDIPTDWFAQSKFIRRRRDQLRADPSYAPWSVRAIVLKLSNEMLGHVGFHEPPNPDSLRRHGPNAIEFGYTVYPAFRRRGYATEAVRAIMSWAANDAGIETFVVSIAPDNAPSQAVARRLGFAKVGEHIDEDDGPEEVFALSAAHRLANHGE